VAPRSRGAYEVSRDATPVEVVKKYIENNWRVVFWPSVGDAKGPKEKGWPEKRYTLADYRDGLRVGVLTGTEVSPEKFLHDVDIDWVGGSLIAQALLPQTSFVYGRQGKRISHCFYTVPEALPSFRYEDVDKSCLIELRGTKTNGDVGLQSMVPPSVWTKGTQREPLSFVKAEGPAHLETASYLKQRVCLAAIGMLLAKHLGQNGFGHEPRLAWAGFLLRAGLLPDDLIAMGEALSVHCNNREVHDVRRAVESTAAALTAGNKKVKGGPALAKMLGDKGKAIVSRINEWLGRDSDFIRTADGLVVKDNQDNIARALQLMEVSLSYHEFSERILVQQGGRQLPLDDATIENLWLRTDREMRFRPSFTFFEIVVKNVARESSFHAVRDYLDALTWDKVPRLDEWLVEYGKAENTEYVRAVSAIALIAAVKRIRMPGCKYDEMLVLESGQGMNKSSALRALCPREEWFSDDLPLNVDSKQVIERTLGKWIIEASDLAGKRRAEVDQLKSMLSRQIDGPARLAYARNPIERPRQFILIGTTNSSEYLLDATGARRFWPVTVLGFDVGAIIKDRDQLWAEAAAREAAGESIRLPERLWPVAAEHQEMRSARDAWEDILRSALLAVEPGGDGRRRVPASALWNALGVEPARRDRAGAARVAEIMQKFGFKGTTVRTSGCDPERGYIGEGEKLKLVGGEDVEEGGLGTEVPF